MSTKSSDSEILPSPSMQGCARAVARQAKATHVSANVSWIHEPPGADRRAAQGFPRPSQSATFITCAASARQRTLREIILLGAVPLHEIASRYVTLSQRRLSDRPRATPSEFGNR